MTRMGLSVDVMMIQLYLFFSYMVRSPYDDYGCCKSCGYTWCPDLNSCVRVWETYCKSFDNGH